MAAHHQSPVDGSPGGFVVGALVAMVEPGVGVGRGVDVGFTLGLVEGVTDAVGVGVVDGASATTAKPCGGDGTEVPMPCSTNLPVRL